MKLIISLGPARAQEKNILRFISVEDPYELKNNNKNQWHDIH